AQGRHLLNGSHLRPRRSLVAAVTLAFLGAAACTGSSGEPPATPHRTVTRAVTSRTNLILILTDDQRWDELAQMPIVQSQLVARGIDFPNAFVVNPECCPSRSTILTGEYSHKTGVYSNKPPDGGFQAFEPDEGSTLATWLHGAGYHTGLVGKYLNGYDDTDV